MAPDKRDELYNNLINSGRVSENEIGTIDDFKAAITDEATAKEFHQNLLNSGIFTISDIGDAADFWLSIRDDFSQPTAATQQPTAQQPRKTRYDVAQEQYQQGVQHTNATPISQTAMGSVGGYGISPTGIPVRNTQGYPMAHPQPQAPAKPMAPAPRAGQWSGAPMQQTPYAPTEDEGNLQYMPIDQGEDTKARYDAERRAVGGQGGQVQRQREEVDSLLAAEEGKRQRRYNPTTRMWEDAEGNPTTAGTFEEMATSSVRERDLQAAQRALGNAQKMIDEANAGNKGFIASAGRGMRDKFFDPSMWDFGITDLTDQAAIYSALQAYDEGGEEALTESQRQLLDAKALELATTAYFGSEVGRGYKAGQVTAEAIPFMFEMAINPAAGIGKGASKAMVRYALKKFGKEAIEKGGKRYIAKQAMKYGTRIGGDIVGASGMAVTTGAARTAADALDRMAGNLHYDTDEQGNITFDGHTDAESWVKAFGKAFASTTIENYSEMLGNYFGPALGLLGKGAGKVGKGIARTKAGAAVGRGIDKIGGVFENAYNSTLSKKIGLQAVGDFISKVPAGKVAGFLSELEKRAQWHGVMGEYAEEVAGGILNALVVGDQTLDTDQDTGVFNLDNNIDTFLGVALMGGFFSGARTVGYGAERAHNARQFNKANRMGVSAFGDGWADVQAAIESDPEAGAVAVLSDPNATREQREAALRYAQAVVARQGMEQGKAKRDAGGVQTMQEAAAEQSYNTGYDDATTDELRSDINMAYTDARQTLVGLIGENAVNDIDSDPLAMQAQYDQDITVDDNTKSAIAEYVSAKSAWDGVQQRISDDAADRADQRRAEGERMAYKGKGDMQGTIRPITIKEESSERDPETGERKKKTVYLVNGNIAIEPNGNGLSREGTDKTIYVYDPETGETHELDPFGGASVLEVGEVVSMEDYLAQNEQQSQAEVQQEIDNATGRVNVAPNTPFVTPEGRQGIVKSVEDDNVIVQFADGGMEEASIPMADLQQYADALRRQEYEARHPQESGVNGSNGLNGANGEQAPTATAETPQEGNNAAVEQPQVEYPRDKQGNIDYDKIGDATTFATALGEEFGEDAPATLDDIIAEETAKMDKQNAVGKARIRKRLAMLEEAKAQLTPSEEAPAEAPTAEVEQPTAQITPQAGEVPDMSVDKASDARARGYRMQLGVRYDRQGATEGVVGSETEVKFTNKEKPVKGRWKVVEAGSVQPSHIGGQNNPLHFITEAQPKDRTDKVSDAESDKIAAHINPKEIIDGVTAYTGAPVVNSRGEVIQGNNRATALRKMGSYPESAAKYKQYLIDHAADYGLNAEDIASMNNPVMVREVDVDDNEAIRLGQFTASDTESGGKERISADKVLGKLTDEQTASVLNIMLRGGEETDETLMQLIDRNGADVLTYLAGQGAINDTQVQSAYGRDGRMTPEAKNDLADMVTQNIFKGGADNIKKVWNEYLPVAAQKALLQAMAGDLRLPKNARLIEYVRNAIMAVGEIKNNPFTKEAKTAEEYHKGLDMDARQADMLSRPIKERYSELELYIAVDILLTKKQNAIKAIFWDYQRLFLEKGADLFEAPKEYTPEEAIEKVFGIKLNKTDNNEQGNDPGGSHETGTSETGETAGNGELGRGERQTEGEPGADTGAAEQAGEQAAVSKYEEAESAFFGFLEWTNWEYGTNYDWNSLTSFLKWANKKAKAKEQPLRKFVRAWIGDKYPPKDAAELTDKIFAALKEQEEAKKEETAQPEVNTAYAPTEEEYAEIKAYLDEHPNASRAELQRALRLGYNKAVLGMQRWESERSAQGATAQDTAQSETPAAGQTEGTAEGEERDYNKPLKSLAEVKRFMEEIGYNGSLSKTMTTEDGRKFVKYYASGNITPNIYFGETTPRDILQQFYLYDNIMEVYIPADIWAEFEQEDADRKESKDNYWANEREKAKDILTQANIPFVDVIDSEMGIRVVFTDKKNENGNYVDYLDLSDTEQLQEDIESVREKADSYKQPKQESNEPKEPKRLISDEQMDELKERLRKKLRGQLNSGIDPETLSIGLQLAVGHIERGLTKFADFAKRMIEDLGDAIRPYLKSFYNGARDFPGAEKLAEQMTPYDEVRTFDVENFDKSRPSSIVDTAKEIAAEQEIEKQVEKIKKPTKGNKKKDSTLSNTEQGQLDLFGKQTTNNNDNGLERPNAVRTEGGTRGQHADSTESSVRTNGERTPQESGGTDGSGESGSVGALGQELQHGLRPNDELAEKRNTHNNHAERGKDYAPKDVDARIEANIAAIERMQQLSGAEKQATPADMAVLRKFSGWGGLGKAFDNYEYSTKLKALLGEEAYEQANLSRYSAFYTPAKITDTLWDIARALGFKGGKVLEGSAGIGNILGAMPTDMSEQSSIEAVEIDPTTGGILSLLYPDAKVNIKGFEETRVPNGSVDLAITNVPFVADMQVPKDNTGDADLSSKFKRSIQDFCIAKNVRKLKEGGIGIFITSSGTLDNSDKLRSWLTTEGNADVVGAYRMHKNTFGGASVTTDIIVIRKRVNKQKSAHAIDVRGTTAVRTAKYTHSEWDDKKKDIVEKTDELTMDYNTYFVEHPEMMGGEMKFAFEKGDTYRPTSRALYPKNGVNQDNGLKEFVQSLSGKEWDKASDESTTDTVEYKELGEGITEGSMFVGEDGGFYVAQQGLAVPLEINNNKVKGHTKQECFEAYTAIKDAVSEVLDYETKNAGDEGLQPLLDKLNNAYDDFVSTYGHFQKNTSISFLKNDMGFSNVRALETMTEYNDEQGNRQQSFKKGDIFSKRVVEKEAEPKPTNAKDGVIASMYKYGRIDIPYISKQIGKSEDEVKREILENGIGFENPQSREVEVTYEYLSGNVREKLRQAQEANENGEFDRNIKALQDIIPINIPSHLIEFSIGSSWLDPKLYSDYISDRTGINVEMTYFNGMWMPSKVNDWNADTEKNRAMSITSDIVGKTVWGHEMIIAAMQNRTIEMKKVVRDRVTKSTETIADPEATRAIAAKIDEIRADFKDWARAKMQSDPAIAEQVEQVYNERFNNFVPKSIPNDFVPEYFGGATHTIKLQPHQAKAAIRATTQPLMIAHEVGAGKTYTLITAAMEMRRIGTARKPMIVVQNATVGQFVESAKTLYPNAKILTLEDAEHNMGGRLAFYSMIKYNDWDMIIIPQSTFDMIPDSEDRRIAYIKEKIDEREAALDKLRDVEDSESVIKQAENEIADMEAELEEIKQQKADKQKKRDQKREAMVKKNAATRAKEALDRYVDDVEDFDQMGIDAILVDEAHNYKRLGFATAMRRGVKGIDPAYSKRAQGVFLKAQSVMERTGGKNVVFATGTPISNTAAEVWTFMRYLMPAETLREYDIYYFDDFVRNFGNLTQMLEFGTNGKFRENNRFAGYINMPELARMWSGVADTKLTDDIEKERLERGEESKIPDMEGGKATDIYLPQTKALRSIMKYIKQTLDEFDKMKPREKKKNSHIPLTMYGLANRAAVDVRLILTADANAEVAGHENGEFIYGTDDPQSKTNEAVRQTLRSLEETKDYKGTVAIFADLYQNKATGFNLYEEIKRKLVEAGVPEEQVVIMKSGMDIKKKLSILDKVNSGEIRVIMGSTATLGTGVNIQERLHTLIHMDAPNRPMDYTQRNGRILRQGNIHKQMGKPVRVLRFGVEDSLDVTAYQRLKTKGAIADSVMRSGQLIANSMENRTMEEAEDLFGDTVAQLSGSEYAMLKQQAEREVRKYEAKRKQYESDQTYIHNQKPRLQGQIKSAKQRAAEAQAALSKIEKAGGEKKIVIGKNTFANVAEMADFFKEYNKKVNEDSERVRRSYMQEKAWRDLPINIGGFDFNVHLEIEKSYENKGGNMSSVAKRTMTYSCEALGLKDVPVRQALLRNAVEDIINDVITGNDFRERIEAAERGIARNEEALEQISKREGKPFEFAAELEEAKRRYEEYEQLMKAEMEAKEEKYAEMDAETTAIDASALSNTDEEDETTDSEVRFRGEEREREGGEEANAGEWYDRESVERIGEFAGYSPEQVERMSKRQEESARKQFKETAEKLHLGDRITFVDTIDEIEGIDERTREARRRKKGWFNPRTGKIVIILGNHKSMDDVMKSIMHEGVAHHGLRQLFGEHFNTFLDNVYRAASPEIRERIYAMAKKHGWDFRTATEEYLATLAEDTDFERPENQSWWKQVKDWFIDLLHKIGFKLHDAYDTITDNELRYILWRSYENLVNPGRFNSVVEEAKDIAKQYELKVGQWDETWSVAAEAEPNATMEYNGRKIPVWAGNGRRGNRADRVEREDRMGSNYNVAADGVAEDGVRFRDGEDEESDNEERESIEQLANNMSIGTAARFAAIAARNAQESHDNAEALAAALNFTSQNLAEIVKAAKAQKKFDKATVKQVTDMARVMVSAGYLDSMGRADVKGLLKAIRESTGETDNTDNVNRIIDIMVKNQLKNQENTLATLLKIKGSRVDARGINVQGKLDPNGQQTIKAFKDNMKEQRETIESRIADAEERMTSEDRAIADAAYNEKVGLQLALDYVEKIGQSKADEKDIEAKKRAELSKVYDYTRVVDVDEQGNALFKKDGTERTHEVRHVRAEYKGKISDEKKAERERVEQTAAAMDDAIRHMRMERIDAYTDFIAQVAGNMKESMRKLEERREAEKRRIEEIHHNANSDMEGRPASEHRSDTGGVLNWINNTAGGTLFAPLASFGEMLRMFGRKSPNGEGYLFNRFMRGLIDARHKEINGVHDKYSELDRKAHAVFGGKVETWADMMNEVRKGENIAVEWFDGKEMKPHTLHQGNLMYIYMVNKMSDGRMKLRHMGIDEKAMAVIESKLDPRLKEIADWLQDDFLVRSRNEYNETHKRMFGASMSAIEDYFPLVINSGSRNKDAEKEDAAENNPNTITTATGAIKKRTVNVVDLDLLNADAMHVILDHIAEMEHWNAFAEYNRDLNTLRSYKRFENQVKNMTTILGDGEQTWKAFNKTAQIAVGSYQKAQSDLDAKSLEFASMVTAAKVAFRINTALKQLLSLPAYLPYANASGFYHALANDLGNGTAPWKWCMENLPMYRERWESRVSGDPRLLKLTNDWKSQRATRLQKISRAGMLPNAAVDALTVSIGAHAVYETRKAQYLKEGYSEAVAEKRAIQDAEIAYNETQQSSEGGFVSVMQVDKSWLNVLFTIFRNASMAYQRQLHGALRNLINMRTKARREQAKEFLAKQIARDGVNEAQARLAAEQRFNRAMRKNWIAVATFGYIVQFAWNFGGQMWYLLFGDDDDKKKKTWKDILIHSLFGGVEGLTGGDWLSELGRQIATGDRNPQSLNKDMPLTSDMFAIIEKFGQSREWEAVSDIINLVVQAGVGVNPQTLTDIVVATIDACNGDLGLAREAGLWAMRVIQVPQSQTEQIYFDEIGMTGEEARKLSYEQLVERYAKYRVKRNYFWTPWEWDNEKAIEKGEKRGERIVKERMETMSDEQLEEALSNLFESSGEKGKKLSFNQYAKREGLKGYDYSDVTKNDGAKYYMNIATWRDIAEDITLHQETKRLEDEIKRLKKLGVRENEAVYWQTDDKLKDLNEVKKEIGEMKKEMVDANGNPMSEEVINTQMENIRKARRRVLYPEQAANPTDNVEE